MSLMLIEKLRQQLNAALPQRFQEDWTRIDKEAKYARHILKLPAGGQR